MHALSRSLPRILLRTVSRLLIGGILSALLLAGCTTPPTLLTTAEAGTQALLPVKVQTLPYLSFSPYFIAQEEGYFAEQGLDVEFVQLQRSSDAIPALLQGDLDVLSGAISFGLLNAMASEGTIKLVADKGYAAADGCTDVAVLARKDLLDAGTVESALAGGRVSVNPLSIRGYVMAELLKHYGTGSGTEAGAATMDEMDLVDVASPALAEAFANDSLDYVVTAEPWTTRLIQEGHADVWVAAQSLLPDLQIGLVAYGPNLLTKAPDVGERFMSAYLQGVRQYNQGKTERNLEIIAAYTELTTELLQSICWGAMRSDGQLDLDTILAFQSWGMEQGSIDRPVAREALFDPQFIEFAAEQAALE